MASGDWIELYTAAKTGDLELVKYHLATGVDPNYQHPEFMTTPLIVCIEQQHIEVARHLLQNGADPTVKEDWGPHTPLSMAQLTKNQRLIDLVASFL